MARRKDRILFYDRNFDDQTKYGKCEMRISISGKATKLMSIMRNRGAIEIQKPEGRATYQTIYNSEEESKEEGITHSPKADTYFI